MRRPDTPREFSDGVVTLNPLVPADAEVHLAGEDVELQRWLSEGVSTAAGVAKYLRIVDERWNSDAPYFHFAIRIGEARELAGTIDIQLEEDFIPEGKANLAYGIYPRWRWQGIATRAVELAVLVLRDYTPCTHAWIRVNPLNDASAAVARRAGFTFITPASADDENDIYERETLSSQ